ncbi:MAG: putative zinc dependent peptidase [Symbiobacteriaceae bacterium]|jgi:hypothetical protein|nr:putative zinc dependent peptidase [Symbiobacteriaceae bacterium]
MHLDFAAVETLLPALLDLAAGRPVSEERWEAVSRTAAFPGIMGNCCVAEEGARHFTLAEWREIWEMAAREAAPCTGAPAQGATAPHLGVRQRYLFDNARATLGALPEIEGMAASLRNGFAEQMEEAIQAQVLANLPPGTPLDTTVYMILGSASGGFYNDSGIYFDLNQFRTLRRDPALMRQFLAHEIWHTGHGALAEHHPAVTAPWFINLYMLQSEGVVNCLIGGTREWCEVVAADATHGDAARSRAFLAYLASMDEHAEERLRELAEALGKLLTGDIAGFRAYAQALPDHPGYLHGVYMARTIERALGRGALIETIPDPVSFLRVYQAAARVGGAPLLPDALMTALP